MWKGDIVMRKVSRIALIIALSVVAVYLCSCATIGGGIVDVNDPIIPSPELRAGVVDPETKAITITKDNITIIVEHWSKYRLDRKYTTIDMRSPFFYLETWPQSFQSDVFHITIKNDTPRSLIFDFKESILEDDREYVYRPSGIDDFKYKFITKKYMDLKTKKGLELAPRIMLSGVLGKKREIKTGKTAAGFLPFTVPSPQATKVFLTLVMEKAPETATGSYEQIKFNFDYIQDLVLRSQQATTRR